MAVQKKKKSLLATWCQIKTLYWNARYTLCCSWEQAVALKDAEKLRKEVMINGSWQSIADKFSEDIEEILTVNL